MKIKNEYVQIKVGNRTYTKQNMILDIYLKRLFDMQYKTNHDYTVMNSCFLNFTAPLDVDYDSVLSANDFDFVMRNYVENSYGFREISTLNKNTIKLKYIFNEESDFYVGDYNTDFRILQSYYNKPLYGIGFGYFDSYGEKTIYAYLDTRDMNIVINDSESFSVSRLDILQSEGIVKGFDFPLHLVNDSAYYKTRYEGLRDEYVQKAFLTNVYYSNEYGNPQGDAIIPSSIDLEDNSVTYHVTRTKHYGNKMGKDLKLPFELLKDDSKSIILEYSIYEQLTTNFTTTIDTGKKYYMVYKNEDDGNLKIKLSIERSE